MDAINSLQDEKANDYLQKTLIDTEMPLDVRRQCLQLIAMTRPGADRVLALHQQSPFPDDLESEVLFLLRNHSDGWIRQKAEKLLPENSGSDGKKIHNVQAVLALQGNVERGRELFNHHKEAACARCHRVTGEERLLAPIWHPWD